MNVLAALWAMMRAQPIAAGIGLATFGAVGTGTGYAGYWVYMQPNPQIVAMEKPVTNGGAGGIAPDVRAHAVDATWQPKPQTTFKAGDVMWTLRNDCFLYKTSGPITRAFIGIDSGTVYQLPLTYPPTRTEGCARRNFATQIPKDLPPGKYRYEVAVLFYKNPLQPEVRTAFPSVEITVVP
jgi:hypothetical protein